MNRLLLVVCVACVALSLVGCNSQKQEADDKAKAATTPQSVDEKQQAVKAWTALVDSVKANIPAAKDAWLAVPYTRKDATITLSVLRDDVKQSDSLKSPYSGEITMREYCYFGSGKFLDFEKTYKFTWAGGKWTYCEQNWKLTNTDERDNKDLNQTRSYSTPIKDAPASILFRDALK